MDSEKNKDMTFDEWSKMWDRLFEICKAKGDFRALLIHTAGNYNPEWNKGK